jgi:hypothetical protein
MGPFEFTKDIMFEKNYLMNDSWTEKQYNAFIVNRALSLFPDTIFFANEMNKSAVLDKKMQHDYLFYSIRKKRRFEKWPWKKTHVGDLELVQEVYKYSREKALQALKLLTSEQLTMIRKQQKEKGGIIYGGDTS